MSAIPESTSRGGVGNRLYKLPIAWKKVFTYFFAAIAFFYIVAPFAWINSSPYRKPLSKMTNVGSCSALRLGECREIVVRNR